jgi:hypothetical protein
MEYDASHIEYISILRSNGLGWAEVTEKFNNKFAFSPPKTLNAVRKTFKYNSESLSPALGRDMPTFKPVAQKLSNFHVHETGMAELFERSGLKRDQVLRVVVQPDTHVRNADKAALKAYCKFLDYYRPHMLINLGDYMDMEAVSHWGAKDTSPRRLIQEIRQGIQLLSDIGTAAGPQCKTKKFIMGNHEDWLDQYLTAKVPEFIDGLEELGVDLTIGKLLRLDKFGYDIIPINEILRVGTAHFIHGYYTSATHAKKHLDVFGVNIYYGHLHDVQSYSGVSIRGLHEAMSLGCLCRLDAPFLKGKPNNWCHAFGVFEFRADGTYTRYVPIIVNGTFSYNGVIF